MGFFSRHRKAFKSVIASFGILLGLLAGCASKPIVEQEKEPENAQVMPISSGNLNLGIDGLSANYSGDGSFSYSGGTLQGSVSRGGWTGTSEAILEIKNISNGDLNISLKINAVKISSAPRGNGKVTVWDNDIKTAPQTIEGKLSFGQSFTIYLEVKGINKTTSISISSIQCSQTFTYSVTFKPCSPINLGRFFVDGTEILEECTKTKPYGAYNLKFVPNTGYSLVGWDVDGSLVSNSSDYSFSLTKNYHVVFPRATDSSVAMFSVAGIAYDDLKEAITKAKLVSGKTVVTAKSGTLKAGSYTLDEGVRLLIPYDSANTFETTEPEFVPETSGSEANVEFRRLTLKNGTLINVAGGSSISVGSKMYCASAQYTSYPIGGYGRLELEAGAKVILNSGSNFYCWGFATGDGEVEAKSGANVYELFQIGGYRGGGATKKIKESSERVFPFNQYFVQNIEAKLIINHGAKEIVTVGIYTYGFLGIGAGDYHSSFRFIGADNDGMFSLTRGYLTKKYLPTQDRLQVEIHGDGAIRSINFKLGVDFDSSQYVLPITNNIDIDLAEGDFTVGIEQDVGLLPGSTIKVGKGSKYVIKNNRSVYLYGKDDWKAGYAFNGVTMAPVYYSPTTGSKPNIRKNVVDALFDVNGTVEVQSGCGLYSCVTGNPAPFISSKRTGNVLFASEQAAKIVDQYTYQAEKNEGSGFSVTITYGNIPVNRIQFRNGDLSITSDALPANSNVVYDKVLDRWSVSTAHAKKFGLFKTLDDNTIQTVLLHDDIKQSNYTGLFYYSKTTSTSYNAADDHYYYLNKGVVSKRNEWWKDTTNGAYYHFGPNQYAYQNMSVVLMSMASGDNPARGIKARHFFDAEAKLLRMVSVDSITSNFSSDMTITKGICYYNGIKAGFGLFENQSHVYLAEDDGTLMTNGTYYVPSHKINNIKDSSGKVLTAGLYYFDKNGHMYDSNFKVITRGNAS